MLPSDRDGFLLGDSTATDQDGVPQDTPTYTPVTRETFERALSIWREMKGDTAAIRETLRDAEPIATPVRSSRQAFTDAQVRALGLQIAEGTRVRQREVAIALPRGAGGRFLPATQAPDQRAAGNNASGDAAVASPAATGATAVTVQVGAGVRTAGEIPLAPAPAAVASPRTASSSSIRTAPSTSPAVAVRPVAAARTPATRIPSPPREVATPQRGGNGRFLSRAERDGAGAAGSQGKGKDSSLAGAAESLSEAAGSLRAVGSAAEAVDPTMTAVREVGEVVTPVLAPLGGLVKAGFGRLFGRGESEEVKQTRPWYKRILKELVELRRNSEGGPAAAEGGRSGLLMPLLTSVAGFAAPMLMGLLGAAIPLLLAGAGALLAGGIGWKIGEWINEKWGQQISDAIWDASEWVKEKWGGAADWFSSTWESVTTTFDEVAGRFGAWLDGLADFGKDLVDKAAETAKSVGETVSEVATSAGDFVSSTVESVSTWAGDKVDAVKDLAGKGSKGNRRAMIEEMTAAGISDPREKAAFLAQMDHESGGFKRFDENLNYSAEGLMKNFPKYYKTLDQAKADVGKPEAIANRVYGGRLGNTEVGDGHEYRGRGFVQLTGKANYAEAGKAMGLDLVNNPEMAAAPQVAARVATWFWKKSGAGTAARTGDLKASRKRINGGLNGMDEVRQKYDGYLGALTAGTIDATGKPKDIAAAVSAPMAAPASVPVMPAKGYPAPLVMTSAARPVSASLPAPKLASMAPAPTPAPPPAPAVQAHIGSNARAGSKTTVTLSAPVSQNLSDRTIAHVATGSLGG